MDVTREEHMQWAKQRALDFLDQGLVSDAFDSLVSDLNKHSQTQNHMGVELGMKLRLSGRLNTVDEMRQFIEGFN